MKYILFFQVRIENLANGAHVVQTGAEHGGERNGFVSYEAAERFAVDSCRKELRRQRTSLTKKPESFK